MAKGNKKRGNRSRARAAIRLKMAETGQSYTTCLRQGEAARDGEPAAAGPRKLSDAFQGQRFPIEFGPLAAVANGHVQQIAASTAMARYVDHANAQLQAERLATANPLAEAITAMIDQHEAVLRAATYNPLSEAIQQYTAQQQMWRWVTASPLADAIKQLNPLGDLLKHVAMGQHGVRQATAAQPR